MRYSITAQQRNFFLTNHYIEFEGLFEKSAVKTLQQSLEAVVMDRADTKEIVQETIFEHGRDVSRKSTYCKKLLYTKSLAMFAAELCQKRSLIFGFDQYYVAHDSLALIATQEQSFTLEKSSIQGLVCGMVLCLQAPDNAESEGILPKVPGSVIFFDTNCTLQHTTMKEETPFRYLMFTWADSKAVYRHKDEDLQMHALKQLGYMFGDQLKRQTHPILTR